MFKPYLSVKPCKTGRGVFTSIEIPAKMPVLEVGGNLFTDQQLTGKDLANYLQVGPNTYLGPSGGLDDYLNHSCDPNCRLHIMGDRCIIFSLYIVPANNQLTVDYSTSSTDTHDTWKMNCVCGSYKCRKVISGYQYLAPSLLEEYKKKEMLPLFITFPIFQKR